MMLSLLYTELHSNHISKYSLSVENCFVVTVGVPLGGLKEIKIMSHEDTMQKPTVRNNHTIMFS